MMSDIFNLNVNKLTTVGSVGIGTSSPATPLHVFAETNTTQLSLSNTVASVTTNDLVGAIGFKVVDNNRTDADTDFAFIRTLASQTHNATAAGTTLTFGTTPNNSLIVAERLRIDSAGNVGIGTSTVTDKLQVQTSSSGATPVLLSLVNNTGGSANATGAKLWMSGRADSATNRGVYLEAITTNTNNAHDLAFATSASASSPTERLRITSDGNVGIGTSSPNASAILDAQSTTKGVRMPNMTTTQKNAIASPAAGLMVYDTTLAKLCVYTTAWETITSL